MIGFEIYEERQTTRTSRNYNDRTPEGGEIRYRRLESAISPSHFTTTTNEKLPSPESENSNKFIYLIGLLVVVLVCAAYGFGSLSFAQPQKVVCPQFKQLSEKYGHQEERLWRSLKNNIENVLNQTPEQPSVFLLAYNDRRTVDQIMADIVNATAQCMHSRDPIKLNGRTFANAEMLHDYGVVLETYRKQLENEGIMYVEDLHETPAAVAQAFHTICDIYTPFVHKSIIFFTFYVDEATTDPKRIHELVETKLSHNWNTINHDTLNALVGRVTDQVFFLHSES